MSDNFLSDARYSNFFLGSCSLIIVGGRAGVQSSSRGGGGYNFQKQLKVGGGYNFCNGTKRGTHDKLNPLQECGCPAGLVKIFYQTCGVEIVT